MQQQYTLSKPFSLSGKGLHTGKSATLTLCPAPQDTGIVFRRVDRGGDITIPARGEYVVSTGRSTTLGKDGTTVHTVEHLLSALTGMGVDNALVEIDGEEVPILDGSAAPFCEKISEVGLLQQGKERRYIEVPRPVEVKDPKTGSWVRVTPLKDSTKYESTIDFPSKVLSSSTVYWDGGASYERELSVCRTFVFFHEVEPLFKMGLIRGGDLDNAIVIMEHPVSQESLDGLAVEMGRPSLRVGKEGYLSNIDLHFPDECARHKMMDLIGDMRLCGGFLRGHVQAYKPGHHINTLLVGELLRALAENKTVTETNKQYTSYHG